AAARQSSAVHKALGEITEMGTPIGNIMIGSGGWGSASLSMSIVGTKGRGSYRATLERRNGVWGIGSSRVALFPGRSIDIELEDLKETVGVPISAGHQLSGDAIDEEQWSDIKWDQQHVRLLMPPGWIEETRDQTRLEFKMDELDAFARLQVPPLIERESGVTHPTIGANLL